MKELIRSLFCLFFLSACTPTPKSPAIHIAFTNNKQSLLFTGMDQAIMHEIARDSGGIGWPLLVPVYRMPADTDLKNYQPVQPGKYQVADTAIVFTPDTPFAKGQTYFVRYYRFGDNTSALEYLQGRNRMGKPQFTDLIFKQ